MLSTSELMSFARLLDVKGDDAAVMERTAVASCLALVAAEGVPLVMVKLALDFVSVADNASPDTRPAALRNVSSSDTMAAELAVKSALNTRPEITIEALEAP